MNTESAKQGAKQFMVVAADSIVEQPESVEVIYLDCLKQPGEWDRLSEEAKAYVAGRWPGYIPGGAGYSLGDLAIQPAGEDSGIVSIGEAPRREVSVMLQPVFTGKHAGAGECVLGPFVYVRLSHELSTGTVWLLDDCEEWVARKEKGAPWTTPDGRVWGDVVIGDTLGLLTSMVAGGMGAPAGRVQ
jgi:hypothetical protein